MWGISQFLFLTPSQCTSELFLWCVFSLAVAHIEDSYLGVRSPFLLFLKPQMVSRDSPPLPSRQAYVYYPSGMSGWTTHAPWGGELAAGRGQTGPPRPPLAAVLGQRIMWRPRDPYRRTSSCFYILGVHEDTEFSSVFSTDGGTQAVTAEMAYLRWNQVSELIEWHSNDLPINSSECGRQTFQSYHN